MNLWIPGNLICIQESGPILILQVKKAQPTAFALERGLEFLDVTVLMSDGKILNWNLNPKSFRPMWKIYDM